jgi:gas vesicle protein
MKNVTIKSIVGLLFAHCRGVEQLNFTAMKNTTICIISALGGAMLGAAVAMLTTPQSGKELRGKLHDAFDETAKRIHDDFCSNKGHVSEREVVAQHE